MRSARLIQTFLFHWAIHMAGWTVVSGIWWAFASSDLAAGAFVSAMVAETVIVLCWWGSELFL